MAGINSFTRETSTLPELLLYGTKDPDGTPLDRNFLLSELLKHIQASPAAQSVTLGAAAATFALDDDGNQSGIVLLTGDAGGNTLTTITGAVVREYVFIMQDALVTFQNDDSHSSNTFDLESGSDLVSAQDKVLKMAFDGTSFYQTAPSSAN